MSIVRLTGRQASPKLKVTTAPSFCLVGSVYMEAAGEYVPSLMSLQEDSHSRIRMLQVHNTHNKALPLVESAPVPLMHLCP